MAQFSLTDILEKVQGVKKSGNEYKAQCPAHDDKNPSLSITEKDGKTLLYCHAGCTQQAVLTALGLWEATRPSIGKIVKVYDYVDASGQVLHQTVRYEPKNFRQRRPDPARPGKYIWSLKGIQTVLYRLPDVMRAPAAGELVLIVEGEKDADTAATLGYPATACPMGAGKWNDGHSDILTDAHVVIIPDQDDVGKKHAARVIRSLHKVGCSIRTLHLPAKDLTAWVEQGGTDLDTLLRDADVTVFASSGSGTRQIPISTDITAVLDAAVEALGNMPGAPIVFQRSQGLSRVLRGAKAPKWLTRSPDAPNLMRIDKDYLRELMAASAEWIRLNKNEEEVSSLPPEWAARGLLARGEWTFPLLEGLVTSPTLRPDGSLLDTPGYDPDTGLYYVADGTIYPPILNAPRQSDAASAIGDLQEVIQDFRFADERLHQSVTYAAILTLAARHAYAGNTPAFVVTANTPASGKGLLVDVVCLIGTGIAGSNRIKVRNPS